MSNTTQTTTPADENHPHSIYGASGAKRWRRCPGCVNVIQRAKANGAIPERTTSDEADEGTQAHDWADKVLTGKCGIEELPDEFRLHLEGYIGLCNKIKTNALAKNGRVFNEATVPLFYRPQDQGTLDFAAICDEWIQFVDLKYGKGIKVDAEDNDQLVIYCVSLIHHLEKEMQGDLPDDMKVVLAIYQPRHYSFNGDADVWFTTVRELKDIAIDIDEDYQKAREVAEADTDAGEEDLNPGDWCGDTFCEARNVCIARRNMFLDPVVDFPDDEQPVMKLDQETLTPEQVSWICQNGKATIKFINDVIKGETERLQAGGKVHGMKLVGGKLGNRTWADEEAAETFLKTHLSADQRYAPRKLITAPQALTKLKGHTEDMSTIAKVKLGLADEETMKKSKTQCLIHRPEGKPILVPVEDERPALEFKTADDDFEEGVDTGDAELDALM